MLRNTLCVTIIISLAGCGNETASTTPAPVESASAQSEVTAEVPTDTTEEERVFVIDVRSKEEWDGGHVESAAHIPHTEIIDRIAEVTDDKDAKIVVYCAVGGRAGVAKEALEKQGFTNVENGGGYDDVKDRF